ncbi:MAG: carbohydrate ABC transporter permease [Propionibacteriaceae bacterium]|nr:carbohydrate ABC transporter permease [Propionibacteriaceae bacterium]
MRRTMSLRRGLWNHGPLLLVALITIFPFYVMFVLSVQPGQAFELPGSLWPSSVSFEEFVRLLARGEMGRWLLNTVIYSVVSVVVVLILASLAAYAFAKVRFPGRELTFWLIVSMVMIPYHLTLIPKFLLVSAVGGLNTYWGLILPTVANIQALFLMRQFIAEIPDELIEAARVDGAGDLRIFWSIILPQCKPILATMSTFVFLWHWNDFLWPLVGAQRSDMYMLTVGLASLNQEETSLATTMAGSVITFVPIFIIFMLAQRYFVQGVVMTGIK